MIKKGKYNQTVSHRGSAKIIYNMDRMESEICKVYIVNRFQSPRTILAFSPRLHYTNVNANIMQGYFASLIKSAV